MKAFSLKEYLKNPSKRVVTRDGRKVTIHCTNYGSFKPIIAEIEGLAYSDSFYPDGKFSSQGDSWKDIFFAPEKEEGWINIFSGVFHDRVSSYSIFKSKEDAEKFGKGQSDYVTTIKIEWEE